MYTPNKSKPVQKGGSEVINIKRLTRLILANWYFYAVALLVSVSVAVMYTRALPKTYRTTASLLIEQEGGSGMQNAGMILEGFGLHAGNQNIDNQVYILSSSALLKETLQQLDFDIECYRIKLKKKVSTYPVDPVRIIEPREGDIPRGETFIFEGIDQHTYNLKSGKNSALELDTVLKYGQELVLQRGSFTIDKYPGQEIMKPGDKLYIGLYHIDALVGSYQNGLNVELVSQDATIIRLALESTNKTRDLVFLDKLTEVYMARNLDKKNHEANRVIEFIDEQLEGVTDSLIITENQLQEFRSRNQIMDVSAQAEQIIGQALNLENQKAQLTLQANYYDYLTDYLSADSNNELAIGPTTMDIADPILERLMQELAALQTEYSSSGVGDRNPVQAQLEVRIRNTKRSIMETLESIKQGNQMAMEDNEQQIRRLNRQAAQLPVKERQLLGIERKFNLNNELYTFLLQKRAEAQIQKASNRPDNELVDPAKPDFYAVGPNPMLIMIIALFLGAGIPTGSLIIVDMVHNRVTSDEDVKMISNAPIVGHVPRSKLPYRTIVLNEPASVVAEAFRSIRARMEFLTKAKSCPVIMVTSSFSGEGKSYVAVNMASAYSLSTKETILIDFDLRRPTSDESFYYDKSEGLSTYLIGKSPVNNIIIKTDFPHLYIIPPGPISPNPGELVTSEKVQELFDHLKKEFEMIIIDSPPIGVVPDAYAFSEIADSTVVVVRNGYSKKRYLDTVLSDMNLGGVKGMGIIINDIKPRTGLYSPYNYSYKYESKKKKRSRRKNNAHLIPANMLKKAEENMAEENKAQDPLHIS